MSITEIQELFMDAGLLDTDQEENFDLEEVIADLASKIKEFKAEVSVYKDETDDYVSELFDILNVEDIDDITPAVKKLKQENKELAEVLANRTLTAVKEAEEDIKQTIEKAVEEVKESHKESDYFEWCKEWCRDNLERYMPYNPLEYKICNGLQDNMEEDMVMYYTEHKANVSAEWTDSMDLD